MAKIPALKVHVASNFGIMCLGSGVHAPNNWVLRIVSTIADTKALHDPEHLIPWELWYSSYTKVMQGLVALDERVFVGLRFVEGLPRVFPVSADLRFASARPEPPQSR